MTTSAPPHMPGERFQCRVDIEDICISVEGDAESSTTNLFWEEVRVACKFNGSTQRTRWLALPTAMEEAKKELRAAMGDAAATAQTGGLLALPYTAFNNVSYEASLTSDDVADPSVTAVTTVRPKRFHMLELEVEAQNKHRMYSISGGKTGDRAPTSGNMEVISASLNRNAAKMSAWTRSVFSKIGSGSGGDKGGAGAHRHSKAQNAAALTTMGSQPMAPPLTNQSTAGDDTVDEGNYVTIVHHVDLSEAYNTAGGRRTYCLVVKPASRKLPGAGVGTPLTISFTVAAHYGCTESVPRNFHELAVVVDQFVLDFGEAASALPPDPKEENGQPRPIVAYAFGYTANTAASESAMEMASRAVPVAKSISAAAVGGEPPVRVIDFDRLHAEGDEHKRTPADYAALPTSCVVVSGSVGQTPENAPRLGNRVVCVSRFKTSPDGLCKPSFKCQLAITLVRYYGTRGESMQETAVPINLASLLNEEVTPQRIRAVRFGLGEIMYVRLRRCCFHQPALYRAPLLLPYDYDNSGIALPEAPSAAPRPAAAARPATQDKDADSSDSDDETNAGRQPEVRPIAAVTPAASDSDAVSHPATPASSSSSSMEARRIANEQAAVDAANPFFTLEPQEPERTSGSAGGGATYDPLVAAATAWGGHSSEPHHSNPPAVELVPTASSPFFTAHDPTVSQRRSSTSAHHETNLYSFGATDRTKEENEEPKAPTAAFELTPME